MLEQVVHVTIYLLESLKVINRKFTVPFRGVNNEVRASGSVVFSSSSAHSKLCLGLPPDLNILKLKQMHCVFNF
jgi:hypothetical protein